MFKRKKLSIATIAALFIQLFIPFLAGVAHAGTMTNTLVRFDRVMAATPTTGTVCAKPATTDTEGDVRVTFPTGFVLGAAGTFTVNTTNLAWPSGGTAWTSINTATDVSSQVVTFPSGDLTPGTLYCFNWTSTTAVTTSAAGNDKAGTVETRTGAAAQIDIGSYSASILSTDDQVTVTASVNQSFSFALSGTSDALGALSTGSVISSPTPRTATVNTNAKNGWYVWAKDSNTGLNSSSGSYTIASTTPGSNSTLSIGAEGYNMGVTSSQVGGSGSITVAAPFVGGSSGKGGGLDTSLRTLASSNGTAKTAVLTMTNNATIDTFTAAATDYTDVITIVAAGLF